MDIISKNPYRYLGVYSNSPTRERVANKGKMNAFLKVGKPVSFPLDLPNILPSIDRTTETVADAEARLTLPTDQISYAQFWFLKSTPLDDVAFNHLLSGNAEMAQSIWEKKDNVSSLQNRLVMSLLQGDVVSAIRYADPLYSHYADDFQRSILGDGANTTIVLWKTFLDALLDEGIHIPSVVNTEWKSYVSEKTVGPLIDELTNAIAIAKASKGKECNARLAAGQKLMNSTRNTLSQLKNALSVSDIRYQSIADKLANEILQCGIDYYNDSDDDDSPAKAMSLQEYALSIAVGQIAKDRCKENVDILKKVGREHIVRKELATVTQNLKALREDKKTRIMLGFLGRGDGGSHAIDEIEANIKRTLPLLQAMRQKLGISDNFYMQVSSAYASAAINAIVEVINVQQEFASIDRAGLQASVMVSVRIMNTISQIDMDSKTRSYYNGNKSTLDSINSKLNPSGCYIATMVYGDYDHPQVMVLREFRDSYLAQREWGKEFIKQYYKYSPRLVEKLKDCKWINKLIRSILDRFIEHLKANKQ